LPELSSKKLSGNFDVPKLVGTLRLSSCTTVAFVPLA
jgi:hypothetical protein